MNKMQKRLLLILIILSLFFVVAPVYANTISISVDGSLIDFPDQQPFIDENSRTMVPIRMIENLGAIVNWDGTTQIVGIEKGSDAIILKIDDPVAKINGEEFLMDTNAILTKQGRTVVPLRFISEGLQEKVSWDKETQTVEIRSLATPEIELIAPLSMEYPDVFNGFFQNTEYSNPGLFLYNNSQTRSNEEIRQVAQTINDKKDLTTISEIFKWMRDNLDYGDGEKFARTSQEIADTGIYTGCTDNGLIFASIAREKGIPCVFVMTGRIDWIRDRVNNSKNMNMIRGHILVECYVDGEWYIVDTSSGKIYLDYDKTNMSLPDGYYIFSKSIDVWDTGIENESENHKVMLEIFSDFDLSNYDNPLYQYIDIVTGNKRISTTSKAEESSGEVLTSYEGKPVILGRKGPVELFYSKYFNGIQCKLALESNVDQSALAKTPYLIELFIKGADLPEGFDEIVPEISNNAGVYKYDLDNQERVIIIGENELQLINLIAELPENFLEIEGAKPVEEFNLQLDKVVLIPASPESGFNFPYVIKLPENEWGNDKEVNIAKKYLMLDMLNNGYDKTLEECISDATMVIASQSQWSVGRASSLDFPIMMPVIPRHTIRVNMEGFGYSYTYEHALDRVSVYVRELVLDDISKNNNSSDFERAGVNAKDYYDLDDQIVNMIKHAHEYLAQEGYLVEEKIILEGYSASGSFSDRFATLHPEIIKIVVSGATIDDVILPKSDYENELLSYPLGVADYKSITGKEFNIDAHNDVARLVFMGKEDTNNAADYTDCYFGQTIEQIDRLFGHEVLPRALVKIDLYGEAKGKGIFIFDRGTEHSVSSEMDAYILEFIKANLEADKPVYPLPLSDNLEYTIYE